MAIRQVKTKEATKDGRTWMVDLTYRDYLGRPRRYHSKKFATRREAKDHEAEFKINIKNMRNKGATYESCIQKSKGISNKIKRCN